jgi:DNA-binding NarL/FixJ family response regulator
MNLVELKQRIDALQPGMAREEFERLKRDVIAALERCGETVRFEPDGAHAKLSKREREVMSMMLEGQRLKQIAASLDISVKTVTTHRSRLMKKLRVDDNLGLYRYGIRNGLISV